MAGSDGAILLTTARWSGSSVAGHQDESPHVYLHDVVKSGELPQLVRIVKGSYLGLGAPSLPNPSLSSTALVASAGTSLRVAVQCVKFKDSHKTVNVGPKLAIPESFDGYFEILNEDGRAVRCMESVAELARKFPDSCLVRQSMKVFYQPADKSPAGPSASESLGAITERSRTLSAGELLVLVAELTANSQRFLRCLDSRGDHVYLALDTRAKFSAVAKEDHQQSISGVHRIRALLNKRLPLTVRMVSGGAPAGLKIGTQFCAEMRLLASFREEMIVAMPLGGGQPSKTCANDVVIIPASVSLKLQLPVNRPSLKASKEFARMTERCLHQYGLLSDRIQVYDAHFSKNLRFDGQHWRVPVPLLLAPLRRSTSDLIQSLTGSSKKEPQHPVLMVLTAQPEEEETEPKVEVPVEYDEIDQIYDYIRGFAPLPKSLNVSTYDIYNESRSNRHKSSSSEQRRNVYNKVVSTRNQQQAVKKPTPPPIETIPTNRNPDSRNPDNRNPAVARSSPEPVAKPRMYRQRSALPSNAGQQQQQQRLYSKNPALVMHRTAGMPSPAESKQSLTPSPLFNIRYQSMTNLLASASPADSDTLGSSQSGGRCSGGSAGSAAVRAPQRQQYPRQMAPPAQHRLFQLHRPRSLTDLLWGRSSGDLRKTTPLKIQLHPTVVADVTPSSARSASKRDLLAGRRRHSGSNHLLNPAGGGSSANSKKHTIFYHL